MACNIPAPLPTGTITASVHNNLPLGVLGGILTPGSWGFGYYFSTGKPADNAIERTPTVRLATVVVTVADLGSLGNSARVDISGTLPLSSNPYVNGCYLVLINDATGEEAVFAGWPTTFNKVLPPNICAIGTGLGGTYPGNGHPYGSWSFTDYNPNPIAAWRALVTSNTSKSPTPFDLICPGDPGVVGVPYSSFLVGSGGATPYLFQLPVGPLPPGLSLNAGTGEISGTPTVAGNYPFVVDIRGNTAVISLRFPDDSDFLTRGATYLNRAASWTRFMWCRQDAGTPTGISSRIYHTDGDTTFTDPYIFLGSSPGTNDLIVETWDGTTAQDSVAFVPTVSTWFWVALVYDSVAHTLKFIVNGTVIDTLTVNFSTFVFVSKNQMIQAGDVNASLSACMVREWQETLTLTELAYEALSYIATRTANLLTDTQLARTTILTDLAGGHDWSKTGSPTFTTGPKLGVPVSCSINILGTTGINVIWAGDKPDAVSSDHAKLVNVPDQIVRRPHPTNGDWIYTQVPASVAFSFYLTEADGVRAGRYEKHKDGIFRHHLLPCSHD